MATINDRRTDAEKQTHTIFIVGTDRFMSGWGGASGGASFAAWACRREDVGRVFRWVCDRGDMARVRTVRGRGYRPGASCAHLSIYAVGPDHPALS